VSLIFGGLISIKGCVLVFLLVVLGVEEWILLSGFLLISRGNSPSIFVCGFAVSDGFSLKYFVGFLLNVLFFLHFSRGYVFSF
jgi:hypothetical protein